MPESSFGDAPADTPKELQSQKIQLTLEGLAKELYFIGNRMEALIDLLVVEGLTTEKNYNISLSNVFAHERQYYLAEAADKMEDFFIKRQNVLKGLISDGTTVGL